MGDFNSSEISKFDRKFFEATDDFTIIGKGSIGGKAKGLAFIRKFLDENKGKFGEFTVNIPRLVVIATDYFDEFLKWNNLYDIAYSSEPDALIGNKFQKAELPMSIVGDLRALIAGINTPLAVRSSSMLEDALYEPFAGIYSTKMIPNNQLDTDTRFRKLIEAIKFVYASVFFKKAKDYISAVGKDIRDEKMAVIIQEVVGNRFGKKFYPEISGVARSYNYYSFGKSNPKDGVVNLALGLGKTIVDGGISWTFSPAYPNISPPFTSIKAMLDNTQREFWAVNMEKPFVYDPINEAEYLIKEDINSAEQDGTLDLICSTYDAGSDRLKPGIGYSGPRVINFSMILDLNFISLNSVIKELLKISEDSIQAPVEIEFAVTLKKNGKLSPRFGFLQIRPMVVTNEEISIGEDAARNDNVLFYSERVLGNGELENITDIVFVKPETFKVEYTQLIAEQVEEMNRFMKEQKRKYLLIGFGRWGSTDPWLGIPVEWGQISEAKVIVECMLPEFNVELSQGSHFFHNINSFQVLYFSIKAENSDYTNWKWINENNTLKETQFVKIVNLQKPLSIKVDGRTAKGVILK